MNSAHTNPLETSMLRSSLLSLRSKYAGLPVTAHKQIGLRAIRNALALDDRNMPRVNELVAIAAFHLPHAQAAR